MIGAGAAPDKKGVPQGDEDLSEEEKEAEFYKNYIQQKRQMRNRGLTKQGFTTDIYGTMVKSTFA